jgi:diaminopimelate epimerase
MAVRVTKMSGAGNDFLLLGPAEARAMGAAVGAWARRVCRRGLSVGADGVVLVEPAEAGRLRVRFFNPDGSGAFCGNGTRCAVRFARLRGLAGDRQVLDTAAGEVTAEILGERVRLVLPPPRDGGSVELDLPDTRLAGRLVHAGVPHYVVRVEALAVAPLARWGPLVRRHPALGAEGANLDLIEATPAGLAVRTWERGVEGETLACGSGAVAAAHVVRCEGGPDRIRVIPASGIAIEVELPGDAASPRSAVMTGDARVVFEGEVSDEAASGF